jgi:hypothetical protein
MGSQKVGVVVVTSMVVVVVVMMMMKMTMMVVQVVMSDNDDDDDDDDDDNDDDDDDDADDDNDDNDLVSYQAHNSLDCYHGQWLCVVDVRYGQMGRLSGHQAQVMALAVDTETSPEGHDMVISGSKDHYIKVRKGDSFIMGCHGYGCNRLLKKNNKPAET